MEKLPQAFQLALESLDKIRAVSLFQQALAGRTPLQVIEELVVPALEGIGEGWQDGRIALSQVYLSGRICEELVDRVLPPSDPNRKHQPRLAIVVLSDYHLLGKRIVYALIRASGFEVFDYGRLEVDDLVERALADKVQILLISTLMLPSALKVREVREKLAAHGATVLIGVGGAPFVFDPDLWQEVGADAMGRTASDALAMIRRWMGEAR
jgi:methanogenic corrinoid protein MtbC1